MVYAFLVHSMVPNPQLHSLAALMQQFQSKIAVNTSQATPLTPSKHAKIVTPPTPIKGFSYDTAPSSSDSTTSVATRESSKPISSLMFLPGFSASTATNSTEPVLYDYNGQLLSSSQVGLAGSPPESVTMYMTNFFDNFDGQTQAAEPLAQAIAIQTSSQYYQQKQFQMGVYNSSNQAETRRKMQSTPSSNSMPLDSVWASPAFSMISENAPITDGEYVLPENEITKQQLIVVWRHHEACMFSIVCYEDESRLLALQFLQVLPKLMADQYKNTQICSFPREILMKPEELLTILHTYLPKGMLLILPNSMARQLKREIDSIPS